MSDDIVDKNLEFPDEVWVKHNHYDQPYIIGQGAVALGWTDGARRYVPDGFRQKVADEIESLRRENERLEAENGSLQAEIDRLMLEYCPEEMTPIQILEWRLNQRLAPKGEAE